MKVLIVANPGSTRFPPDELRRVVEETLGPHDTPFEIIDTPKEGEEPLLSKAIERALADGCTRVIAAGGDGTVTTVAEAFVLAGGNEQGLALGILPAGTANVLAHELGIPQDLAGAVKLIEGTRTLELDAIEIDGRHYLTQVGIGPDALMIRETSRGGGKKHGRLSYFTALVRQSLKHRARRFTIELDGKTFKPRAWQILIANIGVFAVPPFSWGEGIDPTDGKLDLCIYNVRSPRDYAVLLWRIVTARHRRDASTQFHSVRESVRIESDRPLLVQGDGELIGKTPIEARVARQWLRVIVPDAEDKPVVSEPAADAPADAPAPSAPSAPAGDIEAVAQDVGAMMAEHSRTWPLQGLLRHPVTAFGAVDAAIYLWINSWPLGPISDRLFTWISRLMHYGEGWVIVVAIAIANDPPSGLEALAEALPVLGMTTLVVNFPMKAIFRRKRPFHSYVKARVVGPRPLDYSFPSGHTAAGFAGAVLFTNYFPAGAPLFYAVAFLVGISRIYLGVHYPSDVLIGALSGAFLALGFSWLVRLVVPGLG